MVGPAMLSQARPEADAWRDKGWATANVDYRPCGHALDDTLGAAWIEKSWTAELRADSWAGCILAKTNLSPADLTAALGALAAHPSPAHPAWGVRLPAIRAGYSRCGGAVKIP